MQDKLIYVNYLTGLDKVEIFLVFVSSALLPFVAFAYYVTVRHYVTVKNR